MKESVRMQKTAPSKGDLSLLDENQKPIYRTIKMPIKRLFREDHIEKIEQAVQLTHRVVTLALDFVKLYVLHEYRNTQNIPVLDENFYNNVIRVVSRSKDARGRPTTTNKELCEKLLMFHEKIFLPLSPHNERVEVTCISEVLKYAAASCATVQENNIKMNYTNYVRRYVNQYWIRCLYTENGWAADFKMPKADKLAFYRELKQVKEDILFQSRWSPEGYRSLPKYHSWLESVVNVIYPAQNAVHDGGIYYDVHTRPHTYLHFMLVIQNELEGMGVRLYSPLCLRSSLIPKYIKLDYCGIIDLLLTKEDAIELEFSLNLVKTPTKAEMLSAPANLTGFKMNNKDKFYFHTGVWRHFMKFGSNKYTRHLLESKNYVFDNSILTDGIGVSVLQIRKDRIGKKCASNNAIRITPQDVPYLDQVSRAECEYLLERTNVVACDPGKKNIIFLNSGTEKLRYTSQQRSVECRFKKNKRAMVAMKTTRICPNGQSVVEVEQQIQYNSKTCIYENFAHYITQRRQLEEQVKPALYAQKTPRKLTLSAKLHTKQSEDRLLNKIIKTFSTADKDAITLAWGNWNTAHHMRNFIPTPGIGLRRELCRKGKSRGLLIGRAHEAYTSCTCNSCHSRTEYFKTRTYTKNGEQRTVDVHGLLRCQNERCSKLWNRDVLGSLNIREVSLAVLEGRPRPVHFTIAHPAHAQLH